MTNKEVIERQCDLVEKIAASVGDPKPGHPGGPDTEALIAWSKKWDPVDRALRLAWGCLWLISIAENYHEDRRFENALDEIRHQEWRFFESLKANLDIQS